MHRRPFRPCASTLAAGCVALALVAGPVTGARAQATGDGDDASDVAADGGPFAATVDGVGIPLAAVDTVTRQIESDGTRTDREAILDELIDMELLAHAAERAGLDARPAIATALRLQRVQTLANAWLADESGRLRISDDRLREEYELQAAALPEREFRASHVLLATEAGARDVLASLAAGADFAALAAERSLDPSGTTGGGIGWVSRGDIDEAIVDSLEGLVPGAVAEEPVATDFGFHVLRLDEARGASRPDYAAVKPGLRDLVVRKLLAERVEALRAGADIELR